MSCLGLITVSGLKELKSFQGRDSKRFIMSVSAFLFRGNYSSRFVWILWEDTAAAAVGDPAYWGVGVTTVYGEIHYYFLFPRQN